jgi:hypothetical protein
MRLQERLQALTQYLKQCERENDFDQLRAQQFTSLLENVRGQVTKLEFIEGAEVVSLLQGMPWTMDQRKDLITEVQSKVLAKEQTAAVTGRLPMQDFTSFCHYLRQEDWDRLCDPSLQSQALHVHLREIMEHLGKLTLRCPSEDTYGMLTTVLLMHDQGRFSDPIALRSVYLSVKAQAKAVLAKLKKEHLLGPIIRVLPSDPKALDPTLFRAVFGGMGPAAIPTHVNLDTLATQRSLIKLRISFALDLFVYSGGKIYMSQHCIRCL